MAACLVQRHRRPYPEPTAGHGAGNLGVPMTSGEERDEQRDKRSRRTEDLMREAPPPSELGDVEDAVAPEVGGDLTEWSPPGQDEDEGDA